MNIKKTLITAGVTSGVALASFVGVAGATTTTSTSGPDSLIEKIATKFNLNKDEVKAVFDEEHTARQAEMKTKNEEHLQQLVTDGKITVDQKAKIIAKQAELQTKREANRDAMKDKTDEERKAAMEAERTELEQWAKDNGIDMQYLRGVGGRGPGGPGFGGGEKPVEQ